MDEGAVAQPDDCGAPKRPARDVFAAKQRRSSFGALQARPGAERWRFELSLQLALGGPLIATKGFPSRETEAAFQRAQELSRELQCETDLIAALRGLGYVYHVRANFRGATGLVEEVVALAKRSRDPALLAEADHLAGMTYFHFGQFQAARDWLEKSAEASAYGGHHHLEAYGINMSVFCRAYLGHCAWYLGYPVRSLEIAPKRAVEARNICAEYRFDYYGAWSSLVRAWAIAEPGQLDEVPAASDTALCPHISDRHNPLISLALDKTELRKSALGSISTEPTGRAGHLMVGFDLIVARTRK